MELVNREKLIAQYSANPETKGFMELVQDDYVVEALKRAEVVDAALVVHAKWEINVEFNCGERIHATCSHCRTRGEIRTRRSEWGIWHIDSPYCPSCGAKMDLEDK